MKYVNCKDGQFDDFNIYLKTQCSSADQNSMKIIKDLAQTEIYSEKLCSMHGVLVSNVLNSAEWEDMQSVQRALVLLKHEGGGTWELLKSKQSI